MDLGIVLLLRELRVELAQRPLEALPGHTLTGSGLSDNHVTVPGNLAVVDLDDLGDEFWHWLEVVSLELVHYGLSESATIVLRELDTREQIREEGHEERQIKVHQLWLDEVHHGSIHDDLLRHVGVGTLERASRSCDRNHKTTETVIVVVLL